MDIQLDQMDSRNAKKVAQSKANMRMGNFMETVNSTDGIYGDKSKENNGDGKPKMSKKGGLTFIHDGKDKLLHGGDYITKSGQKFSGENTTQVVKGLKPYVTIREDMEGENALKAGQKIYLSNIKEL